MKPLQDITFGFSDAENYRRRENKDLFNKIFLRTEAIGGLQAQKTFFLVGEKGTGKTAYAVYLSNSPTEKMNSFHKFLRETEYLKFVQLRRDKSLSLSDYTDIWKVIILLLFAKELRERVGTTEYLLKYPKFKRINDAIDEYYNNAFAPEITSALQLVENSSVAVEIMARHVLGTAKLSTSDGKSVHKNESVFQTNLLYIQRMLQDALSSLKIPLSLTLFIDGIDIRPASIPYADYLDCVKGLANATWSLNNDFFPSVKDSNGRLKCVLLLRPDIFNSLGLQNRNTKLKDNSVFLSWVTDYSRMRSCELFLLADRMFAAQQDVRVGPGETWDQYFPFDASNVDEKIEGKSSFAVFLRYSYHRPRDILTMLDLLNEIFVKGASRIPQYFTYDNLFSTQFKNRYGEYLLGEIKDSLSFYYNEEEFELFLKFFEFLQGKKRFSYEDYQQAFSQFEVFLGQQTKSPPDYMRTSGDFLQFLYDQNILCFIEQAEGERFIRWCFRERSPSNVSPKVKEGLEYEIHYGLANTLNTGKELKKGSQKEAVQRNYGKIKFYDTSKKFGYIEQPGLPIDIFFKRKDVVGDDVHLIGGIRVSYQIEKDPRGGVIARDVRALSGK